MQDPRVAFIDESHRQLTDARYGTLLAAVVINEADEAAVTARARSRLQSGQRRYHWRDEGNRSRRGFVDAFTKQDDTRLGIVIASTIVERANRVEQGRVFNLWRLLAELNGRGVDRLVIESRQAWNDRNDRREIERARHAGVCPADLVYSHLRPPDDPVLWVADAVAGAASAHLFGDSDRWWAHWTSASHVDVAVLDHRP